MNNGFFNGTIYSLDNNLINKPLDVDYIRLYQIGENIMERGSEVHSHRQRCHEISYITTGQADFYVNGKKSTLKQGDIHIVSRGCSHEICVSNSARLRYIFFGFEIIRREDNPISCQLADFYENAGDISLKDNGTVYNFLNFFTNELYNESSMEKEIYSAYAKLVLLHTYRLSKNPGTFFTPRSKYSQQSDGTVFNIMKYIDANIVAISRVSDIAKNLNYSPSYISRVFAEKVGVTIHDYISKKKIDLSCELLRSRKFKMNEIAFYLHYSSYNSFNKAFKRYKGISPTEYLLCEREDI